MEFSLAGAPAELGPCAIVVGAWDPISISHFKEFFFKAVAASNPLPLVPVLLWPPPAHQLRGSTELPLVHSNIVRQLLLETLGFDCVATARLEPTELLNGALPFLNLVRTEINVEKLILACGQSLGPGTAGNLETIQTYCQKAHVKLSVIDAPKIYPPAAAARAAVTVGDFGRAHRLLGVSPAICVSETQEFANCWPRGTYRACLTRDVRDVLTMPLANTTALFPDEVVNIPDRDGIFIPLSIC